MVTIYGIGNCDTVRKARAWLDQHGIDYVFHDYRKDGLTAAMLRRWRKDPGYEALLNRRGTTWRKLPDDLKADLTEAAMEKLMLDNPSIIKRPMLDTGKQRRVGFSAADYGSLFS